MTQSKLDDWLDSVSGNCRYCTKPLRESPPPACSECVGLETRRISQTRENDPYKTVWNSVEDEEGEILSWVKNGTLFIATWEELGRRYVSHARALLVKAREQESKAAGRKILRDACFYRNMAERAFQEHYKILARSQ